MSADNKTAKRRLGLVLTDGDGNPRWPPLILLRRHRGGRSIAVDTMQIGAIGIYLFVVIGSAAAIWWFWTVGLTWFDAVLFVVSTFIVGLGTTLGYHRLFCHKAFEASPGIAMTLGILGAAALQGQIQVWASVHRKHHHHSDQDGDPHSPRPKAAGVRAAISAFVDGHVGWVLSGRFYCYLPYVRDLRKDRLILFIDRSYWIWALLGLILPGLIGAAWHGGWEGFVSGLFAGGILRAFFHLNTTWAVNSLGHLFGHRPFATKDDSTNNVLVNVLSMNGEGLHNNHHAFPWSARFALFRGEIDPGYLILCLLARLGLVWNIKTPSKTLIASRAISNA